MGRSTSSKRDNVGCKSLLNERHFRDDIGDKVCLLERHTRGDTVDKVRLLKLHNNTVGIKDMGVVGVTLKCVTCYLECKLMQAERDTK